MGAADRPLDQPRAYLCAADPDGTRQARTSFTEGRHCQARFSPDGAQVAFVAGAGRNAGARGADRLLGGDGDDVLTGLRGADLLFGGPGRDRLTGNRGDDVVDGGLDDDVLFGGRISGRPFAHDGYDLLRGGAGRDRALDDLWGGPGFDRATVDAGDRCRGVERVLR